MKPFNSQYILDKDNNIIECDLITWVKFFEDINKRRIQRDEIKGIIISTVFLGIGHDFEDGRPLLFKTMLFNQEKKITERYTTYKEALEGHNKILNKMFTKKEIALNRLKK